MMFLGWMFFLSTEVQAFGPSKPASTPADPQTDEGLIESVTRQESKLPAVALRRALAYVRANPTRVKNPHFVSVINFEQPSTENRLYVIDLTRRTVVSYLVAHGSGTGENTAVRFSDTEGSKMSSLGIYLTAEDYTGDNGHSLRLDGVESTNAHARPRAIVMHGADYVSQEFIRQNGRLGRSWGCPAVEQRFRGELIKQLEEGSVLYGYHSKYCNSTRCAY